MQFAERGFEQIFGIEAYLSQKLKSLTVVHLCVFDNMPPKVQKYPEEDLVTMAILQSMMEQQKDF